MRGGALVLPRWTRRSRVADAPVMKAMMRMSPQRERFVDTGEQHRPGGAGSATMVRFGGGFRVGRGWRGRGWALSS